MPRRRGALEAETTTKGDARISAAAWSTVGERVTTMGVINLTEDEIAEVAYRLWLYSGCPIGSDQEHWFRAEEILRTALASRCEDLSRRSPLRRSDGFGETATVAGLTWDQWDGHWEVWEREWGHAQWVWDVRRSGAPASNRAA